MPRLSPFCVYSFALVSVALTACTERQDRPSLRRVREIEIHEQTSFGQNAEAAELAAMIGEALFVPAQFKDADTMIERSLKLDPANPRANFYGALLEPMLALEGLTKKFTPVLGHEDARAMTKLEDELIGLPKNYQAIAKHLTELPSGARPAANLAEVQAHFRSKVIPAFARAADRLKLVERAGGVELRVRDRAWRSDADELAGTTCTNTSEGWDCAREGGREVRVDVADVQAIASVVRTYLDAFRVLAAFDLADAEKLARKYESVLASRRAAGKRFTAADATKLIQQFPRFGLLSADSQLHLVTETLSDTLASVIGFKDAEARLCRAADREASLVVVKSICVAANELDFATRLLESLSGPSEIQIGTRRSWNGFDAVTEPVKIRMNLGRFLVDAPADLKSLLPNAFDANGEARDVADRTMGGLFPDGDFVRKMALVGKVRVSLPHGVADAAHSAVDRVRRGH